MKEYLTIYHSRLNGVCMFKKDVGISKLRDKTLKLFDVFTYLGIYVYTYK